MKSFWISEGFLLLSVVKLHGSSVSEFCCPTRNLTVIVDDYIRLYFDGAEITGLPNANIWNKPDVVDLPCTTRLIAIHGKNGYARGRAAILASTDDGYVLTNSSWKCSNVSHLGWEEIDFDDSTWMSAVEFGGNGNSVWMFIPAISSNAVWIWLRQWTSDLEQMDLEVYCRKRLASAAGTSELQSSILCVLDSQPDLHYTNLSTHWQTITGLSLTEYSPANIQAKWDNPILQREHSELLLSTTELSEQARLKAVSFQHASDWMHSLPITSCGLRLSDEAIRVAVGLRLGANICQPHVCACGALVTARGTHGLSCSLGFGRVARHAAINDLVHRSLIKAGFPAVKEPRGMLRSDGKRPDGTTLIPWRAGRNLVWDATVVDTLAPSYLQATAVTAEAAAEIADNRKNQKYQILLDTHDFIPLALETLGLINSRGLAFISELGRHLTKATDEVRETTFLFQRLSLTIQRFNAVAFAGSFVDPMPEMEEG